MLGAEVPTARATARIDTASSRPDSGSSRAATARISSFRAPPRPHRLGVRRLKSSAISRFLQHAARCPVAERTGGRASGRAGERAVVLGRHRPLTAGDAIP
ncbi:hypothetical protein OK074_3594 [Actinobacteria bacterium OK074]|nr:hypothetical protein OK074_3594 [Actinobacteria bacterium OK074]